MNFTHNLHDIATKSPQKIAVSFPNSTYLNRKLSYASLTFSEFNQRCDRFAFSLKSSGINKGMMVSFMVKPNIDFLPIIFALFKVGAIPVLIDPGMGRQNLFACLNHIKPHALIGIPAAHLVRKCFPKNFQSIKINITTSKFGFAGAISLYKNQNRDEAEFNISENNPEDTAVIIFTTGSTGVPKGVVYTHNMLNAQTRLIKTKYNIKPDDIDMPGFAFFSIISISLGMTVIFPKMNPTRPADVNPKNIIDIINDKNVSFSFGSPALWNTVSAYCIKHNIKFPTLKRVLMAGAPVPGYLHERMLQNILSADAEVYTPYGATEALLTTSFKGSAVLAETMEKTKKGQGYCVGFPYPEIEIDIIKISDDPIENITNMKPLSANKKGEIIVKGPVVSREYIDMQEQNKVHKIFETADKVNGPFWHRLGDIGYIDQQGKLWFCGRKSHRVETGLKTMYTVCCEAIFNEHQNVYRSALVGLGRDRWHQTPVIIIEPKKDRYPNSRTDQTAFVKDLLNLAKKNELTQTIKTVLFHKNFPVDIRHNAKIFREKLTIWAGGEVT